MFDDYSHFMFTNKVHSGLILFDELFIYFYLKCL